MGSLVFVPQWQHSVSLPYGYEPVKAGQRIKRGDKILCRNVYGYEWRDAGQLRIGRKVDSVPMAVRKQEAK